MTIWQDEMFAPVVSIVRVQNLQEAVQWLTNPNLRMVLVYLLIVQSRSVISGKTLMPVC